MLDDLGEGATADNCHVAGSDHLWFGDQLLNLFKC